MTGALWAVVAGLGFGTFQSLNRRGVKDMDVFLATFLQLLVSAIVLGIICVVGEDLSLLRSAPLTALLNFGLAGFVHFFMGWTFLNASQKHIGAARTGSLIGTTPLIGALIAMVTLGEVPSLLTVAAIVLISLGVYFVNSVKVNAPMPVMSDGPALVDDPPESVLLQPTGFRSLLLGLAAALCWSTSPIFIRRGLAGLPSPVLGVTVGMAASALGYGVALAVRSLRTSIGPVTTDGLTFKLVAALLVGLSTWMRWIALDMAGVAVVLALSLVSVPVVNFLSPLIVGRQHERVTAQVWSGSGLIIGGSLLLILLT